MKAQLLLSIVASVAAIPAPQRTSDVLDERADGDFSVNNGTLGDYPDMTKFQLTMTEYCWSQKLATTGEFSAGDSGKYAFDFDTGAASGQQAIVKQISGKHLNMVFDYDRHVTKFSYDTGCTFTSESREPGCGFCHEEEGWNTAWSRYKLDCSQPKPAGASIIDNSRVRHNTCWVKTNAAKREAPKESKPIAQKAPFDFREEPKTNTYHKQVIPSVQPTKLVPRNSAPRVTLINHQNLPDYSGNERAPLLKTEGSKKSYFPFSIAVGEKCDINKTLKVDGYWTPGDGSNGEQLYFNDTNTINAIPIGIHHNLWVGTYDFNRHSLNFAYGSCKWTQDTPGKDKCGWCGSRPWSSAELNCNKQSDAAAKREHGIDCYVAVLEEDDSVVQRDEPEYTLLPHTTPIPSLTLKPRDDLNQRVA